MDSEKHNLETNSENTELNSLESILNISERSGHPDHFIGPGGSYPHVGVYGGHLLGQAHMAAFKTVSNEHSATSLHMNFLNAPTVDQEILYRIERLRDGR